MRVADVLRGKGTDVLTVAPDTTVRELLDLLVHRRIGACVVSADGRSVDGIVSERDVVAGLAGRGAQLLTEPVSAIATSQVATVDPQAHLDHLMRLMTEQRFRHVPVVVDGALAGIISIGDVVKNRMDELEAERQHLADYIASSG